MPLAKRLGLAVHIEPELRERELGNSTTEDFLEAVEATWQDLSFAYPEGESNTAAQQRGLAFIQRLQTQQGVEHIVLSTHGNLITLILQSIDPSVGFSFWKSLTRPDIYVFRQNQIDKLILGRLWKEVGNL
jgi:2,3-bisphosphoglycerate-dependent phosphoglycerate mutase